MKSIPEAVKKTLANYSAKHWLFFSVRPLHDTLSRFLTLRLDSNGRFGKPSLLVFDSLAVAYQFSDKKAKLRAPDIVFMPDRIREPVGIKPATLPDSWGNERFPGSGLTRPDVASSRPRLLSRRKGILLKTVTVAAHARSKEEMMEEEYTSPSLFRGAFGYGKDVMDDQDAALSWNIFVYLQHDSKGGLQVSLNPRGTPSLKWSGGRGEPGIYYNESKVSADFMLNIPMSEIAYVKIIPPPAFKVDSTAGAVAVYTKQGEDYYRSLPTNMRKQTIIGYSVIKTFYSPQYNTGNKNSPEPDLRATLYWDPMIVAGPENRDIKIRFYNNDDAESYRVILEGMTQDGKLARVEKLVQQDPEK
jgi:hypothetical protein